MNDRTAIPLLLGLGVIVRAPFWREALRTPVDGDTAIIGLMARHLGTGTTLWGQPYGSPVEAWLAAPFVAAMGPTVDALRLFYFLMGLVLIPLGYALAKAVHTAAAFPAGLVLVCPPAYWLLLSALPPPLYPTTLVLLAVVLLLTLRAAAALAAGRRPWLVLALAGGAAGLALWTHLMSATALAAVAVFLFAKSGSARRVLVVPAAACLVASAPLWQRAFSAADGFSILSPSSRTESVAAHLASVLPRMHRPVLGILGAHTPLVPDDADVAVTASPLLTIALVALYGLGLAMGLREARRGGAAALCLGAAGLALLAFPLPARSGPETLRFLTPAYLPFLALVMGGVVARHGGRRGITVALALSALHLTTGARLLALLRTSDRTAAPFHLVDLTRAREALQARGVRHAYASYGPAWRLSYESGERLVASQPWNERFLHHPLPFLDEVRFAKNVAWVLTPSVPSDLPSPQAFESGLTAAGGTWRRTETGAAVLYHDFVPPFAATVLAVPGSDAKATAPEQPRVYHFEAPQRLAGLTLVAETTPGAPRLLRSMDVEVSADGASYETVARRRRRGEREDLRWVNGHPQYVIDHDLIAIPFAAREVKAVRVTPVASSDEWRVATVLAHPASVDSVPASWSEWLDPNLDWQARLTALVARPLPEREDWHYRMILATRHTRE